MRKSQNSPRSDGDETRLALIEAAGRLAAERGWADVTAKDVCALAQASTASVNYWFGSRDKLYEAVVAEIPHGIVSDTTLQAMHMAVEGRVAAKTVLESVFEELLEGAEDPTQWRRRLWAREMATGPSPAFEKIIEDVGSERIEVLRTLFAMYLGTKPTDAQTSEALLSSLSTCMMLVVIPGQFRQLLFADMFGPGVPSRDILQRMIMQNLKLKKRSLEKKKKKSRKDEDDE